MKRRRTSTKDTLNMYWKTLSCSCPTVLKRDSMYKELLDIANIDDV